MTPDDKLLNQELRRDEGVRYSPYRDSVGVLTVGVGHNLQAKAIPSNWTYPLQEWQVNHLLAEDIQHVFDELDFELHWWRDMSYERQRVLANMAFNMGLPTLLGFKNTLAAMEQGRYADAVAGMMHSKWAGQVGDRAKRLADMMQGDVAPVAPPIVAGIPVTPAASAPSGFAALLAFILQLFKRSKP